MYANNTLLCYVYKRHIHGFIKYDILDSQMMVRSQSAASLSVFHQTQKLQTGGRFMVANQLALSHESQRLWSQEEFKNNSVGHRLLSFTSTNRLTATSSDLIRGPERTRLNTSLVTTPYVASSSPITSMSSTPRRLALRMSITKRNRNLAILKHMQTTCRPNVCLL